MSRATIKTKNATATIENANATEQKTLFTGLNALQGKALQNAITNQFSTLSKRALKSAILELSSLDANALLLEETPARGFSSEKLVIADRIKTLASKGIYVQLVLDAHVALFGVDVKYHPTSWLKAAKRLGKTEFLYNIVLNFKTVQNAIAETK